MEVIQDSDYILYKAMAENVIGGLLKPLKNITAKCEQLAAKYIKIKTSFLESGTYDEIGESSKKLKDVESQLIRLLAAQDRIEKIVLRNQQRLDLFKERLDLMGIYNFQVDRKELAKIVSREAKNVSEDSLNLNPMKNDNLKYVFFGGKILVFKDDKLDFSLEQNEDVLKFADSAFYHEMINAFPYSVGTIPDECFMSSQIKLNVLRESVLYAASKIKTQTLTESNNELGGMLANVGGISDITKFAEELKNYLNVSVKQCMKKNAPELSSDIDENLRCNEASEFLPSSKRVAVLANGLAGVAPKSEAEESEEIRKEQEKETQKNNITREDLLEMLLADDDEDLQLQEDAEELAKKAEEERKLNEEKQNELDVDQLEKELQLGLRKNDTVDN